jgi:phage tail sheath gpL-like
MAVAFNQIPAVVWTPGSFIEFDSSRAVQGLQIQPHDTLIAANMLPAGSATAGVISSCKSYEDAVAQGGQHSQIAQMVRQYKKIDPLTPVWICPLDDDGAGVDSVGTWTITGTASEDGTLALYMSGRRFTVAVTDGDANTAVVTAAVTAAALLTDSPLIVTDGGAGALTGTSQHGAAFSNQIKIGHSLLPGEKLPAGLSIAVVQPASGSGDADHDDVVTAMDEDQYHTVALGVYTAAEIAKIVTEMEDREGPMRQIEGVAFAGICDSQADITTYLANFNSSTLCVAGTEENALIHTPWEVAAQTAALNAQRVQIDPARHLSGSSYSGISAAPRGSRFLRSERDTLIEDGCCTSLAAPDGGLQVERLVTTRVLNSQAIADYALHDLTNVRTLHAIRYTIRARLSSKFYQFKLADDGSVPRPKVVTPSVIRAELIALFLEWFDAGWVENIDQYMDELVVERNGSDVNRVDAIIPPDLINSFYVFAGQVQFIK